MADFSYTTVPGKIKNLLSKIRDVGVPKSVSVVWLKSIGFTSSNDASLISVLRQIDFIDQSKVPTEFWKSYRGIDHRTVLSRAIAKGYAELFDMYSDAHNRSSSELASVISTKSSAGKQAIDKTVATFRALVQEADFDLATYLDNSQDGNDAPEQRAKKPDNRSARKEPDSKAGPSLHIDIQVHISPESSAEQIESIFASMAKHLYPKG